MLLNSFRFKTFFWPFDDLKIFDMVNFKNHNRVLIFLWWYLSYTTSTTFSAKASHILQIHWSLSPINFNESPFISYLSVCDQLQQTAHKFFTLHVTLLRWIDARLFLSFISAFRVLSDAHFYNCIKFIP